MMHPKICRVRRLIPRTHPLRVLALTYQSRACNSSASALAPNIRRQRFKRNRNPLRVSPPIDLPLTTFNCAHLQSHKASLFEFLLAAAMTSLVSRTMRPAVAAAGRRFVLMRPLSMTTARRADDASQASELGVGELQGAKFRIEPLRRVGEDDATKRARLVCMFLPPPR